MRTDIRWEGHPEDPGLDPRAPVYVISVAAQLTGLHPQTLRTYDRIGLVSPGRAGGGGRRYSALDVRMLREVTRLTALGIGLEGVRRILELEDEVGLLRERVVELEQTLAAVQVQLQRTPHLPEPIRRTTNAMVVWRGDRGRRQ